ncbi:hypothetical protein [Streptomyces sp. H27-D2]|uniref:hypothetical protein n=1 Tax=Streptomyces sp. H27-D2 TaxID=3046304 RepID=UPI002DBCC240|nr:hypothetical protein [Streptomyces sp. H27-D2]MEC4020172.1 hypothetical protein [Streptomyces sp. H27-D2]
MSRRVSLPGADELFRTTGGMGLQSSSSRRQVNGEASGTTPRVPAPAAEPGPADTTEERQRADSAAERSGREPGQQGGERRDTISAQTRAKSRIPQEGQQQQRRRAQPPNRRPSGRERHDEKITVYVSAEELMDLEHARLVLRGEHGLAVDRGRIVREAVAVVLADLESRGEASILVRRLRGR